MRNSPRKVTLIVLLTVAFLALSTSTAAFGLGHSEIVAQGGTGTTETGTGTETGQGEGSDEDSSVDKESLAKIVLLFGAFVVTGLIVYLAWAQDTFSKLARLAFERTGRFPTADWGPPVVGGVRLDETIEIRGPTMIAVGQEGEFSAYKGSAPFSVAWTVDPQDFATPQPAEGERVKIGPKKEGAFKLIAEGAGGLKTAATLTAVEIGQGSSLPFVGRGYGTIVLTTVLLSIAGALALVGSFNAAVATLFGAVAGYIFSRGNEGGTGSGGTASAD